MHVEYFKGDGAKREGKSEAEFGVSCLPLLGQDMIMTPGVLFKELDGNYWEPVFLFKKFF